MANYSEPIFERDGSSGEPLEVRGEASESRGCSTNSCRFAGFELAGWNQQAERMGGDFFEFQELPVGLAVTVADACGRGASAAAVAEECRLAVRRALGEVGEPALVAEHVNQRMVTDPPSELFVTAFFGLIDRSEPRLHYVSAGHGPTWHYSASREQLQELNVQRYPLGLSLDGCFDRPGVVHFEPGDFVVVVTDGFFEWIDGQEQCFGVERLCSEILRHRARDASDLIDCLHRELLSFAGRNPQCDDLTAVVIKRIT